MGINKYTKKLFNNFIQGLLYITPIGATVFIIFYIFDFIDRLANKLFYFIFNIELPGFGIIVMITLITLIGYFGKSLFARPMITFIDNILEKVPVIKIIYTSTKDFMSAFVGQNKKFTEAVLVKMYSDAEIYKLGFITQHNLTQLGIKEGLIAVYLPHSYNFSGNLFVVPAGNVTPLQGSSTDIMKFIVSGGVTEINKKEIHE